MEVYLNGQWYTFDPCHNTPRIGRILMTRGRDAADVAITTAFGRNMLLGFKGPHHRTLSAHAWKTLPSESRRNGLPRFTGNIKFHHAHHLDPRIPNYRLQDCHDQTRVLQRTPILTLWSGLGAFCYSLWDQAQGRMVRFPRSR